MKAILSDIHANAEALRSVLEDITRRDVEEIVCLGDVIGYGPSPLACIDLARLFKFSLMGNHEDALLFKPLGFNEKAYRAIEWTRSQLNHPDEPPEKKRWRWNFLGDLKRSVTEDGIVYVHGSPRDPTREYLFPSDITDKQKMEINFSKIESACFAGHTHVSGLFTEKGYISPVIGKPMSLKGLGKVIVNVGSVGQPRDNDPRACYVLFEGNAVTFVRVKYDFEKTIALMEAVPELDKYLTKRLRTGH
jgi:diadenosine tetraphosphatase ApaH/serine/threonine PP2A family protein phosphatase